MTKKQQQMLQELKNTAGDLIALGYSHLDVDAINFFLSEIERLTTENRRLKNKCNSLWKAINQSTPEHYPSKDDLKWEVIQ
jgi:hypothetical protein